MATTGGNAAGEAAITFRVKDAERSVRMITRRLQVIALPFEVTGTLPDFVAGTPYVGSLALAGGTAPYSVPLLAGLPDGITFELTGSTFSLSGTPTGAGYGPGYSHPVNLFLQFDDSAGASVVFSDTLTMTITPLTLTGTPTAAQDSLPYSYSLTRAGGVGNITETAETGFPAGITGAVDNPNNQVDLTGTPPDGTSLGSPFSPSYSIADAEGNTATWNGTLVVDYDELGARRQLRAAHTSFWDFNSALTDSGRAGNAFTGSVTYVAGPGGRNMVRVGTPTVGAQIATSTALGFSALHSTMPFLYGGMVTPRKFSEYLIAVGRSSGASNHESIFFGVTGGFWSAGVRYEDLTATTLTSAVAASTSRTDSVYVQSDGATLELWVNDTMAASAALSSKPLRSAQAKFYIGNTGVGFEGSADVQGLIFGHGNVSQTALRYLRNAGAGRVAADFTTVAYGTTPDAFAATLGFSGYWKLNETSGTSAANSSGALGSATLVNGASFINTLAPPPGFPNTDYVANFDGTNDLVEFPDHDYTSGSLSHLMLGWFYLDVSPTAGERFFQFGTDTNTDNHGRNLNAATTVTQLAATLKNSSAANLASAVSATGTLANTTWMATGYYYDATAGALLTLHNGFVVASGVQSSAPSAVLLDECTAMARRDGSVAVDGKASRIATKKSGLVSLANLAKLRDLGNGSG